MKLLLNCLILGQAFEKCFTEIIGGSISISEFKVATFKEKLFRKQIIKDIAQSSEYIDLWKVDSKKVDEEENNLKEFTESDIREKLGGEKMIPRHLLTRYFDVNQEMDSEGIHVFIVPTSNGKCLPMVYLSNKKFALHFISHSSFILPAIILAAVLSSQRPICPFR
jgi:hypothetical protein